MIKEPITITVNAKDGNLYDFLNGLKNEKARKVALHYAVELSEYCIPKKTGEMLEFDTPEQLKKRIIKLSEGLELFRLKDKYLNYMMKYLLDFNSDEVQTGIIKGIDEKHWYVENGSRLAFISLYANYINIIDELLSASRSRRELDKYDEHINISDDEIDESLEEEDK